MSLSVPESVVVLVAEPTEASPVADFRRECTISIAMVTKSSLSIPFKMLRTCMLTSSVLVNQSGTSTAVSESRLN